MAADAEAERRKRDFESQAKLMTEIAEQAVRAVTSKPSDGKSGGGHKASKKFGSKTEALVEVSLQLDVDTSEMPAGNFSRQAKFLASIVNLNDLKEIAKDKFELKVAGISNKTKLVEAICMKLTK